jgi:hypothetical protein
MPAQAPDSVSFGAMLIRVPFLAERKAHPPLGAWAEVSHGVEVVVTSNHRNRAVPSGWMVRLVGLLFFWVGLDNRCANHMCK